MTEDEKLRIWAKAEIAALADEPLRLFQFFCCIGADELMGEALDSFVRINWPRNLPPLKDYEAALGSLLNCGLVEQCGEKPRTGGSGPAISFCRIHPVVRELGRGLTADDIQSAIALEVKDYYH